MIAAIAGLWLAVTPVGVAASAPVLVRPIVVRRAVAVAGAVRAMGVATAAAKSGGRVIVHEPPAAAVHDIPVAALRTASTAKTHAEASDGVPISASAAAQGAASLAGATIAPIALPPPPPSTSALGSTFASALLAISEAQQIDPQAAQNASFAYVQAAQQYRAGNFAAARINILSALAAASAARVRALTPTPLPTPPSSVAAAPQLPGTAGGLYGGDAPAIDAAAFIALARGIIDDCTARHDHRLSTAQSHFAAAQADFAARNWEATRTDAKATIDSCPEPRSE